MPHGAGTTLCIENIQRKSTYLDGKVLTILFWCCMFVAKYTLLSLFLKYTSFWQNQIYLLS